MQDVTPETLTAVKNDAINTIFDPAHAKHWRMYNELETKPLQAHVRHRLSRHELSSPKRKRDAILHGPLAPAGETALLEGPFSLFSIEINMQFRTVRFIIF